MLLNLRSPRIVACFALAWFWIWALHAATGMFDRLIEGPGERRSFLLGSLDSFTQQWLVEPLGRGASVGLLLISGIVVGAIIAKFTLEQANG